MKYDIICIGSASKDVFYPFDDIEVLDTPSDLQKQKKMAFELGAKYRVDNRYEAPGGCATNISQGLARLGVNVANYSRIGNDKLGDEILSELEKEKVETSCTQRDSEAKTDLSFIIVDKRNGEHTIFFNRDANERLMLKKEELVEARTLFLSGLYGNWEENLRTALSAAEESGVEVFYNPSQSNIHDNCQLVLDTLPKCTVLFVNKDEAIELVMHMDSQAKEDDLRDEKYLLSRLSENKVKHIAITDGRRGAWILDSENNRLYHAKPQEVEMPLDSTGAGDAFTSGFLGGYLTGQTLETCLQWAIENSRSVVQYYGAKAGLLDRNKIAQHKPLVAAEDLN